MSEVGSRLEPRPPSREWDEAAWRWLEEQFEILLNELNNRDQLIYADGVTVGNTIATAETLKQFSFPKGVANWEAGQQQIEVVAAGTFDATVNTKRIKLIVNGNTIADTGAIVSSAITNWKIEGQIICDGTGLVALTTVLMGAPIIAITDLVIDIFTTDLTIVLQSTSTIAEATCDLFKVTYNRLELPHAR